jgi:integral membrane protein (TIGR00529 family)
VIKLDIVKLVIIFTGIVFFIKLKKPLYISILVGAVISIVLYKIPVITSLQLAFKSCTSRDTISLVLAFYTITYVQRMMEKRGHLLLAERALDNIFNSRRINAMIAPFVIGLLPSAGAVLIAAPIVQNASGDYLTREEQTFVTSYYRHISEAFLPTYSSILLALDLSGVDMTKFVVGMLPMVVVLFVLGYIFYVKKIPKSTGISQSKNKKEDIFNLVISLWPIAVTIMIILTMKIPVYMAVIPVIIVSAILNRFSVDELIPMIKTAFETKLIVSTVMIMVFKELLTFTGVIERLPEYFEKLPIHPAVIFSLIFVIGTLVAGSQAIIALALPLAFATIPNGGLALMILLMCMTYIAMQVSPTHICLAIVTEAFDISFIELVKKTFPVLVIFTAITALYSYLLFLFT